LEGDEKNKKYSLRAGFPPPQKMDIIKQTNKQTQHPNKPPRQKLRLGNSIQLC